MTTLLNYLAVVHDYYLIKTRQAPQAMGHHQHGFVAHDICQQMQDLAFGGRIQTFCRFIEQHQRRIVEQRAGNGQSAQFAAGEHIAILGRTGCGKSTLLQLLTRAWDPSQGEILLNNQPLSDLSEATLRQAMSVVPQRVHLFSATLRDNLLLAAPEADDAHLSATLEKVGLEKLLQDGGLNGWLGEGGRQPLAAATPPLP